MSAASPFRVRQTPRSGVADRVLDWRTQARVSAGELASAVLQALRGAALRVYLVLRAAAYRKRGDTCQLGNKRIAAMAGVNPRTAHREIRALIDVGLVMVRRNFDIAPDWSEPGDLPNEYTVFRPAEAVAAQERRRRREAGEEIPEELAPVVVLDVEHDEGSAESLRDQAERLAHAAALGMRPALEAQLGALDQAAELLEGLARFLRPQGWQRWRHYGAAQDCLRAIDGRRHAARALEDARRAVREDLAALEAGEPGPRGWTVRLAGIRLALGQAGAVPALVGEAQLAAERASATWAPLLVARPAAPSGDQAELKLARPSSAEAPPAPGEPWRAPAAWRPRAGRLARTWLTQRAMWDQAQEAGGNAREKLQRALIAQGFDPGWPDPST